MADNLSNINNPLKIHPREEQLTWAKDEVVKLRSFLESLDKLCMTGGEPTFPLSYDDLHWLLVPIMDQAKAIHDTLS